MVDPAAAMDDAQQIVLVALQQAGIVVPDGAKAGNELNSSALVSICGQALNSLSRFNADGANGSAPVPTSLPTGTAERFRVCTDLAGAVKLLGYRGDLSFHQFLYPSHKDTHALLRFLLDKLSKSSSAAASSSKASKGRKARTGGSNLASTYSARMSGLVLEALSKAHGDYHLTGAGDDGERDLMLRFQSCPLRMSAVKTVEGVKQVKPLLVTVKAKPRHSLIPSLLELNVKDTIRARSAASNLKVKGRARDGNVAVTTYGKFLPRQLPPESLNQAHLFSEDNARLGDGTNGDEVERDANVVSELQKQLKELLSEADKMEAEVQAMEDHISVLIEEHEVKEKRIQEEEGEIAALREAVTFALDPSKPSPSVALEELQDQAEQGKQHMAALQAEWEAVRRPLEEKKAELEQEVTGEGNITSKMMKLKNVRHQLQRSKEKLRVREEQAWTLKMDLKEISGRPKRSSYVFRITELVKNSQKQETDIAKITTDTRDLQRDSNATNDRLRRTYALVDELVFRDAKKDPVCRQSYRQLTTIHETFAVIVDRVLEMDKTGRDIAELQAQLEELQTSSLDVKSVQADLDAVAIETRALERCLASVQTTTHHVLIPT